MKKLLASALLAGLLLGTTSPVFAVEGGKEGIDTTGETPVTSTISASYLVTIPEASTIDLMDGVKTMSSSVSISELTTAGTVNVTASVTNLTLNGEPTSDDKKTLPTTITVDGDSDLSSEQSSAFQLSNDTSSQPFTVATIADSKDKFSGDYSGSINFTFDYANPIDAEVPAGE